MIPVWTAPELTALGRLPMHSVTHADRLSLDGRWRFVRSLVVVESKPSTSLPGVARAH